MAHIDELRARATEFNKITDEMREQGIYTRFNFDSGRIELYKVTDLAKDQDGNVIKRLVEVVGYFTKTNEVVYFE